MQLFKDYDKHYAITKTKDNSYKVYQFNSQWHLTGEETMDDAWMGMMGFKYTANTSVKQLKAVGKLVKLFLNGHEQVLKAIDTGSMYVKAKYATAMKHALGMGGFTSHYCEECKCYFSWGYHTDDCSEPHIVLSKGNSENSYTLQIDFNDTGCDDINNVRDLILSYISAVQTK